jgi:xylonate dehydratase
MPDDTRFWAALQNAGGEAWRGEVYDIDGIICFYEVGRRFKV